MLRKDCIFFLGGSFMKIFKRVISAILSVSLIASSQMFVAVTEVSADTTVKISPYNTYKINDGEFEGWGTSLCWWANRIGYSDSLSSKAAELFYGDSGLRMNIARYNIGGGDDPSHDHITRTDSNMPGYTVYNNGKATYDWSKDANQRNVLFKAIEATGDNLIVEMFSNSPPYYMTQSGCSTGNKNANKNNLKDDYYDDFADYMADVCYHFENEWGVDIQSVEPMNEPYTDYWGAYSKKQEGCHFDIGNSESKMIIEMQKAMDERGMSDVLISGTDETGIDVQIKAFDALSTEAKNAIDRIDTHTYGGSNRSGLQEQALTAGKNLWMSEVDGGSTAGSNAGEMGPALWLAKRIVDDCNGLGCSAWILWQAIDNHVSKNGYNGKKDSGMPDTSKGFWGLAVADHDKNEIILTKKYYAYGQFSRYIRPGATMLNSSGSTVVAYDDEKDQLVIVAVNTSGSDQKYNFDLSSFESTGNSAKVIRTSGNMKNGENWAELQPAGISGKKLNVTLIPNSVTTFVIDNVTMSDSGESLKEIPLNASMVTGSKAWDDTSNNCTMVVDGKNSTFFDGVGDGWVQIDLGSSYKLDAIAYAPRVGYEYRAVDAMIAGSEDGTNWTTLHTIDSKPPAGLNYVDSFDKNKSYRYIKYYVPSGKPNNGVNKDSVYCCNIAEIKLYGEPANSTPAEVKGDINLDGAVTVTDLVSMMKYMTSQISFSEQQVSVADMNKNGRVDILDLVRLKSLLIQQ